MENEQNNNNASQTDINNKTNMTDGDTSNDFNVKNVDELYHNDNHQKIKINEQILKNAKEKVMKINKEQTNNNENINQKNNNKYTLHERKYFLRFDKCLKEKRKKVIFIISLIISLIFLFISIADLINSVKNNNYNRYKLLFNNDYILIIHMSYILTLLIFLILIILSERKENFLVNLIFLLIICGIIAVEIFLFVKKFNSKQIAIINFLICFCLTLMNFIILLITVRVMKIKKNEQQNIEEIINFTDIQGAGSIKISERRDNQLMLNNSETDNKQEFDTNNKKEGITELIEEINKKEINDVKNNQEQN